MSKPDQQITAAPLKIDGVSDIDPAKIPFEVLISGTVGRLPAWPNFPVQPAPGQPADYYILHVYWFQNGNETEIFTETYTYLDYKPEFTFSITPEHMSVDGSALLYYILEGRNGNEDPSPKRSLIIDHTLVPSLHGPEFPDANIHGELNCYSLTPVSQKIRVKILPESVFTDQDEFELDWQGFASITGVPPALTPIHKFKKTITGSDPANGFIVDIAFDPYVKPMVSGHSGAAQYAICRNGVPVYRSRRSVVKIERMIAGEPIPCGGFP